MNLTDCMIAGVVFSVASLGSLQIHGSSLRASAGHEQRRLQDGVADQLLQLVPRELDRLAAQPPLAVIQPDCEALATRMARELPAQLVPEPAAAATEMRLQLQASGEWLAATVQAPGLAERRRWYSPAAYGLCGNAGEVEQQQEPVDAATTNRSSTSINASSTSSNASSRPGGQAGS